MAAPHRIDRYEVMWEWEESLSKEIKESWCSGDHIAGLGDVAGSLRRVMTWRKG
jgi:hypothetical protein